MDLAAPVPTRTRDVPRTRSALRVLAVLAVLFPLLLLAVPATAAPVPGGTSESATAAVKPPATSAPHCALAAGAGQQLHCFATFRAAVAYGTDGRIADAPLSADALTPAFAAKVKANAVAAASSVLGIEYADANMRGATLTLFGTSGCDNSADVDFRFASLPAGWNDRITSFNSFSNCAQQLFRNTSFTGGSLTGIIRTLANVGPSGNDQASSITFN